MTSNERRPALELRSSASQAETDWLVELQEFRGRVAWAGGRRPAFRSNSGVFCDPDDHDRSAYHLIFRDRDHQSIVGCVRYAPLEAVAESRILRLNPTGGQQLLNKFGCVASDVLEGGRLIVDPEWQRRGLASNLLLAGTALARVLGRKLIWGTAGTRENQERIFLRVGYTRAVQEVIPAPDYADDLCVIVAESSRVPHAVGDDVARYEVELRPQCVERTADGKQEGRRHVAE